EDVLTIRFGQKLVTVKVTALNEHASKDNGKGMYEIIEERRLEEA
ncbi:RNA-binding S4 domain-containing protein, partial [Staphylococcus aureus]